MPSCSAFYIPSPQQIYDAQVEWPEADSLYLRRGHDLYRNKCGSCHYLYRPDKYTVEQWDHQLPEMKDETKLTDDEYDHIKKYLISLVKTKPVRK